MKSIQLILLTAFPTLLDALAFTTSRQSIICKATSSPIMMGIPLLGRFRKKRTIDIPDPIEVGSFLPGIDVEILDENQEAVPVSITEVFDGVEGTSFLVGMPGAFTSTCDQVHLPGFLEAAPQLKELGVNKIGVVTTNDAFVVDAWAKSKGIVKSEEEEEEFDELSTPTMTMIADGDGDLVRTLGLAEDMGFGKGIRSKRFVIVLKDGVVEHVTFDEGMEDCNKTKAETLVTYMTPEPVVEEKEEFAMDKDALISGGVVLLALLVGSLFHGDNGSTSTSVAPAVNTIPSVVKTTASPAPSFQLLDQFK